MIEQIMYFALGACTMGLAALFALPAFWRRALRLTRQRIERAAPLEVRELLIQTDLLRAQFAVEKRRYELQLENALLERAQQMAQVGRQIKELETRQVAHRVLKAAYEDSLLENQRIEREAREADGARAAMDVELCHCLGLNARLSEDLQQRQALLEAQSRLAKDRAIKIDALEFHIEALKEDLSQLGKSHEAAQRKLANRDVTVRGLSEERGRLLLDVRNSEKRITRMQNRLENANMRAAELAQACQNANKEAEAAYHNAAQSAKKFSQEIASAQERIKMAEDIAQELRVALHLRDRENADKIEGFRSEIARLNGVLEAVRANAAPPKELRDLLLEIAEKVAQTAPKSYGEGARS